MTFFWNHVFQTWEMVLLLGYDQHQLQQQYYLLFLVYNTRKQVLLQLQGYDYNGIVPII